MTDEYNPADLAQDKRMSGEFAAIDAYQIVRDAAQTPGRPITRAEALAISHATLENAEAERNASDDAAVSLEEENARLKAELSALRERQCETCKHSRRISDIAYECKRTRGYFVMRAHDWCSWWEQSKKKRGATNE